MSAQQGTGTNTYVQVVPLTLHIGAEIRGVDLSKPLPPEQVKEVRDAFLKWKVVFFRGQHLDHAQHVAMARQFGEPTIGHAVFGHVEGYPEVYSVAKNRTRQREPKSDDGDAVVGLAHRRYGGGQPTFRLDPARRDDPALWRRHVLDQPRSPPIKALSPTMRGFIDTLRAVPRFCRSPRAIPPARASEYNSVSSAALWPASTRS